MLTYVAVAKFYQTIQKLVSQSTVNFRVENQFNTWYMILVFRTFIYIQCNLFQTVQFLAFSISVRFTLKFNEAYDTIMEDHMDSNGTCHIQIPSFSQTAHDVNFKLMVIV
jgi:hypothetical protein